MGTDGSKVKLLNETGIGMAPVGTQAPCRRGGGVRVLGEVGHKVTPLSRWRLDPPCPAFSWR